MAKVQFSIPRPIVSSFNEEDVIAKTYENFDESRHFKDAATKFVSGYLLPNEFNYNFLRLVIDDVEENLQKYAKEHGLNENDFIFLFKGGNVLKDIYKTVIKEEKNKHKLEGLFSKYFGLSDNDFTIMINPEIDDYSIHFDNITGLCYKILNDIREKMSKNKKMFKYYHDDVNKKKLLNELLDNFNEGPILKSPILTVDGLEKPNKFYGQFTNIDIKNLRITKDFRVINLGRESINYIIPQNEYTKESKDTEEFYISVNETLSLDNAKFNLVRMKVGFTSDFVSSNGVKKTFNIGGELIDFSIVHKIAGAAAHFFSNLSENIKEYSLPYVENGENKVMKYKSYTLNYFIEDLEYILFTFYKYPWQDGKYVKRLERLTLLYFFKAHDEPHFWNKIDQVIEVLKTSMIGKRIDKTILDKSTVIFIAEYLSTIFKFINKNDFRGHIEEDNYKKFLQSVYNVFTNLRTIKPEFHAIHNFDEFSPEDLKKIDQWGGQRKIKVNYNL
jgi:hypothetical protein